MNKLSIKYISYPNLTKINDSEQKICIYQSPSHCFHDIDFGELKELVSWLEFNKCPFQQLILGYIKVTQRTTEDWTGT